MLLATNLKLENASLLKKSRIDVSNFEKLSTRNSKLEKFYNKERSKKYRNCGSQVNIEGASSYTLSSCHSFEKQSNIQ
jgi:hypothetical protein